MPRAAEPAGLELLTDNFSPLAPLLSPPSNLDDSSSVSSSASVSGHKSGHSINSLLFKLSTIKDHWVFFTSREVAWSWEGVEPGCSGEDFYSFDCAFKK